MVVEVVKMTNRIRELRKAHGLTLKELGAMLGTAESTVSHYERGSRQPDNETLFKLSEIFDESIGYILGVESRREALADLIGIMPVPRMSGVPLVGTIACGEPILAEQNVEAIMPMPEGVRADFALRCKGDSMIGARIHDGDIVYIRQQPTVDDGQIAAVLIDSEATLKRVYHADGALILQSENQQYKPMIYSGVKLSEVRVLGLAVAFTSAIG